MATLAWQCGSLPRRARLILPRAALTLAALATLFGTTTTAASAQAPAQPPPPPQPPSVAADMSLSIARIPAPAGSLAPFWFRITATNKGPALWGGLVDVDLPSGFTPFFTGGGYVAGGCAPSNQGDATCPVPGLTAGQTVVHDIGLRSAQSGPVSIGAVVRSPAPPGAWTDPNPADNSAQLSDVYDVSQDPNRRPHPGAFPNGICTVALLATIEYWSRIFIPFLDAAIERVGLRGIRLLRSRPKLDNILTCPDGRVVVRVSARRGGRTILLATADKTFKYCCVGRSTHYLKLTKQGRRILAQSRRLRIRVYVRLFDGEGGSVQRSRRMTVGKRYCTLPGETGCVRLAEVLTRAAVRDELATDRALATHEMLALEDMIAARNEIAHIGRPSHVRQRRTVIGHATSSDGRGTRSDPPHHDDH
jgi:hypothetical protein